MVFLVLRGSATKPDLSLDQALHELQEAEHRLALAKLNLERAQQASSSCEIGAACAETVIIPYMLETMSPANVDQGRANSAFGY